MPKTSAQPMIRRTKPGEVKPQHTIDWHRGSLENFTLEFTLNDGSVVEHKSMAYNWAGAVNLAIGSLIRDGKIQPHHIVSNISITRK